MRERSGRRGRPKSSLPIPRHPNWRTSSPPISSRARPDLIPATQYNQEKQLAAPHNTSLAEKMKAGEAVFGATFYTGTTTAIEVAANWGLDFAFIDAEHTPVNIDVHMEKLVLAALLGGIAPLVRVRGTNEWDIRKALEIGATGVIVPQVGNADQMREIIRAAKFPPYGRRGGDASCRAAGFAGPGFQWSSYMERENETRLVI